MRVLYLDCGMGAAGDMLTAALIGLFPDPGEMVKKLNSLGIPGVEYVLEKSVKCGITGLHMKVLVDGIDETEHFHEHEGDHGHEHVHDEHHHDHVHGGAHGHHHGHEDSGDHEETHDHGHHHGHSHRTLSDISHIVKDHLALPDRVRSDILTVFGMIAEAESHVHGVPMTDIHFHEVGTMDAIADVTAVSFLLNELNVDEVAASSVHTGCGKVRCAHGILPVPAPATEYILHGIPVYGGSIEGELCTPTGAALLKHFVTRFGDMPVMRISASGYGMGNKDFEVANCLRALLGETQDAGDTVTELSCNVDDMTAEDMAHAVEMLYKAGALEAYTVPAGMKKGRPGILLKVICTPAEADLMAEVIFKHTSTIGIRKISCSRYILDRRTETVHTALGDVRKKISEGYGTRREKYEYDDIAALAQKNDMSLSQIRHMLDM